MPVVIKKNTGHKMSFLTITAALLMVRLEERRGQCVLLSPRIWHELSDYFTDCYFCMVDPTKQRKGEDVHPIKYPDISSSIAPICHNTTDLLGPELFLKNQTCSVEETNYEDSEEKQAASSDARRRQWVASRRCFYDHNQEEIYNLIWQSSAPSCLFLDWNIRTLFDSSCVIAITSEDFLTLGNCLQHFWLATFYWDFI